jgi:protein-S-isoprenylcysteine O-methyltransferase Ste14
MNGQSSSRSVREKPEDRPTARQVLRFIIILLLMPATLFVAAGRLNWAMGWVYSGATIGSVVVSRAIALRTTPDLLRERARFDEAEDVKSWDRLIVLLVAILIPLAIMIVAGVDDRLGWSPRLPLWLEIIALVLVVLGSAGGVWAMAVNRFFSAVVRIQKSRGHTVVTGGPYRFVRHPAYASNILTWLATPLMLGSLWAFIPVGFLIAVLVVRTAFEDRTLRGELAGYEEYAQQTRYRLLPGVW